MKYIKNRFFLFFISLVFILLIIFIDRYGNSFLDSVFKTLGFCESYLGAISCYHWSDITLSSFLFLFFNFIFISLFLFFINSDSLIRWQKFAKFSIPALFILNILFIISFKPSIGGWGVSSLNDFYFYILPIIFSVVSLFLFFKNKKKQLLQ